MFNSFSTGTRGPALAFTPSPSHPINPPILAQHHHPGFACCCPTWQTPPHGDTSGPSGGTTGQGQTANSPADSAWHPKSVGCR